MFVTLEGIDGSGKTTILNMLAAFLKNRGADFLLTREPGGSHLGQKLRPLLLDASQEPISPNAELCLFLADRAQHIQEVILPALKTGRLVLCDRYTDSTLAYQGYGRGMDLNILRHACQLADGSLKPDLTLLFDLSPKDGIERAQKRNNVLGAAVSEGRFDAESLAFHEKVRRGYLEIAANNPERFAVINAALSLESVYQECLTALRQKILMD